MLVYQYYIIAPVGNKQMGGNYSTGFVLPMVCVHDILSYSGNTLAVDQSNVHQIGIKTFTGLTEELRYIYKKKFTVHKRWTS